MLREISCELFKLDGQTRQPIHFHKGLNIILGGSTGVNSIGKSTMLLIIDFVFGGDAYVKSDAVRQMGNHEIQFSFEFDKTVYRFARNTVDSGDVFQINIDDTLTTLKKDDYTKWLSEQYGMDFVGLQFRNTISRFFRVYGKNNYNELRPLQMRGGSESQESAIHVLITLFNQYKDIIAFEEQFKLTEDKIKAFKEARKYQFIPSAVDGLKKYEENIETIARLKKELANLETTTNQTINAKEIEKVNQMNTLNMQLQDTRRLVNQKENALHLVELNITQGVYPTDADLASLQEFFPNVNLQRLHDIERFHNKIKFILKEEFDASKEILKTELVPLINTVELLQRQIEGIHPSMAFSKEFLSSYANIDRQIHTLENENEAFETRNMLQSEKKQASDRLKSQMEALIKDIEMTINRHINEISDCISQKKDNAPILAINGYNSYSFETPNDTGTGTNFKGMIIYDLSILGSTALPALAHDSFLFPNVSDEAIEQILALYAKENQKQIFIAFDREGNYGAATQSIIKENTVLKLDDDGNALFGQKWSRKGVQ